MKIRISYIMMVMLASWTMISCNQEIIQNESHGYLSVGLVADTSEEVVSKAGDSTEDLVFALDVLNTSGSVVTSVDDHRTVTAENPIELMIGSYSLIARSGEKLNAAFDAPYYEGRSAENFKITPNKTTTVDLTCSLANTKFTVAFPEDFGTVFTDYEVTVTNGIGEKLTFSNKPEAGNVSEAGFASAAYFAVTGNLTWELYLKNTEGGEYRATQTYTEVKAKQHYHLAFEMKDPESGEGGFIIKINLENSWDDESHDLVLDFYKKNMPQISTNEEFSVESGESFSIPIGNNSEKVLSFSAPEGFRSVLLLHENSVLTEMGLPESVEFVGASSALLSQLSAAGFVVSTTSTKSIAASAIAVDFDMTGFFAGLPVGQYEMDFTLVDQRGRCDVFELIVEVISDVDAEAVAAHTGWAAFAKLEGRFFDLSKKNDVTFQYKKAADSQWTSVNKSSLSIDTKSMKYSTVLYSLEPSTTYVFRAVSSEDIETKEITFSTSGAGTIHNLNFDSWSDSNKYPNALGYNIWDSANSSGATTTTTPSDDAVKGKAARLESVTAFSMLAAGNIFTGKFVELAGLGAKLDWGTPFTSRPLALRGYYKYSPKAIDKVKDPYKDLKGQMDQSQIIIFLADWDQPFRVNTDDKDFVNVDTDSGIIAHAQINSSESNSGYVKFTLPLVYRNNRIPKYLVIACASSRYGDYFTGGKGSVLFVDEFELIYDPAELTDDEFNQVFSKVSPF